MSSGSASGDRAVIVPESPRNPDALGYGDPVEIREHAQGPALQADLLRVEEQGRSLLAKSALLLASLLLFALGVVGWLIPVLTGIPFYLAGVVTLGMSSRRIARAVNRGERRLPEPWRRGLRRVLHRRRAGADSDSLA